MVTKSPATCRNYSSRSSLNIGTLNLASLIQNCNSKAILFWGGDQKITTSLGRYYCRFYPATYNFCPSAHTTQTYRSAKMRLQDWLTSLNMQNITLFTAFLFIKWFTLILCH